MICSLTLQLIETSYHLFWGFLNIILYINTYKYLTDLKKKNLKKIKKKDYRLPAKFTVNVSCKGIFVSKLLFCKVQNWNLLHQMVIDYQSLSYSPLHIQLRYFVEYVMSCSFYGLKLPFNHTQRKSLEWRMCVVVNVSPVSIPAMCCCIHSYS